jgi:hypothetical protein
MRKGPRFRPEASSQAPDSEAFAERALRFTTLLADASSLIVLSDIGALAAACRAWRVVTIRAAAAEAGASANGVSLIDGEVDGAAPAVSTDRALVESAAKARLPLLSEDKKVLMAAEERGLDCFDVLIALELLSANGTLAPEQYADVRARLLERNTYRGDRLSWAQSVGAAASKLA